MVRVTISKCKFRKKQVRELKFPKGCYIVKKNGRKVAQTRTKRRAKQVANRIRKKSRK